MPIVSNVKPAISLIFTAATLACHFTSSRRSPCVYTSPPAASCPGHARVRKGWGAGGFELRNKAKWKRNEIHHVGRWTVMRQREKPSRNRGYRFFENRTAETEFSVFEFWGRFGLVRFLENRYPKFSSDSAHPYYCRSDSKNSRL